jgi:hypothetical protein
MKKTVFVSTLTVTKQWFITNIENLSRTNLKICRKMAESYFSLVRPVQFISIYTADETGAYNDIHLFKL